VFGVKIGGAMLWHKKPLSANKNSQTSV